MLQFMRQQHSKLKWVLVLVIVILGAGMVIGLIPFADVSSVSFSGDLAKVGGESVSANEFQAAYRNYLRAIQQQNQSISPEILKAFRYDRLILDSLIQQKVVMAEARRLGLEVTPEELQKNILSNPLFLAGGSFIGLERYEALLQQNELTTEQYESSLRNQLTIGKVESFVTAGVTVSDREAENEYRKRNEKAVLRYFIIDPAKLESKIAALSDPELREYFEKNKAKYDVPEKRKSRYAFVDMVKYRRELTATDDELRVYYQEHQDEYRLPAQVTAQHILFKTQGKTPEQVEEIRKKATDVLARAKKGEDFSRLAMQFSEDTSASQGGNLGTFGRGAMVPEFEQAAFNLGVGAISDLVTTQFGFHIVKVNAKQEEKVRTFDEVKEAIRPVVLFAKARVKANEIAEQIAVDLVTNKDLDAVAPKHGATVRETALLEQSAMIPEFGNSTEYQAKIFSMKKDEIGTAMEVQNGFVVPQLVEIQEKHPASFEEARATVTRDARAEKAREMATTNANKAREQVESGKGTLEQLAASVGGEIKTSDKITRGGSIPDFGSIAERDTEIFSLPIGKPAPPTTFSGKTLVFAVQSRDEINTEEMKKALPALRQEMLPSKKNLYFTSYIQQIQKKMEADGSIRVDESALSQLANLIQ